MSYLRVAAFAMEGMPADTVEIWDGIIGNHLRSTDSCIRAKLAMDGDTVLVVSEWKDEKAYRAEFDSAGYRQALSDITTKLSLPSDPQPDYLFEGDVRVNIS